ncbi:MAG: hypothetical protein RMJ98_07695 [Myxococcales bacterium]|nr:hypothetical protein [Myxococcales bacterium]
MHTRLQAWILLGAASLAQGSCLATSIDDFPEPAITPPFLNGARATPPLGQVLLVNPITSPVISFAAFVRSEDAGTELEARLVADWPDTNGTLQVTRLGAGTFNQERLLSLSWDPRAPTLITGKPLSPGCHPITLVVSHQFNLLTNIPARLEDADFLVWWVFIADPQDATSLSTFDLSTCPGPRRLSGNEAPL